MMAQAQAQRDRERLAVYEDRDRIARGLHDLVPVDSLVGELTGKNLIAALPEALSNAFRHARASRIKVAVAATAEMADGRRGVRLSVADEGVGIPEGGRRSGLRNLKRRAESLGGTSRCGPGLGEDGGGTTVVWEAPL